MIQCIDHGLTTSALNMIVQDKGTNTLFSVLNSLVNRSMYTKLKKIEERRVERLMFSLFSAEKFLRHVIRDEKALQIIQDLTKQDILHNITLYFVASIVVNSM